jgi:hypothetical protein
MVFIDAAKRAFCWHSVGAGGLATMCVRLEDDGPMVEEFELSLRLTVGRDFWCDTTMVTMTQFLADYLWILSQVEVV